MTEYCTECQGTGGWVVAPRSGPNAGKRQWERCFRCLGYGDKPHRYGDRDLAGREPLRPPAPQRRGVGLTDLDDPRIQSALRKAFEERPKLIKPVAPTDNIRLSTWTPGREQSFRLLTGSEAEAAAPELVDCIKLSWQTEATPAERRALSRFKRFEDKAAAKVQQARSKMAVGFWFLVYLIPWAQWACFWATGHDVENDMRERGWLRAAFTRRPGGCPLCGKI